MRDKLIELIQESDILCNSCGENSSSYCAEFLADYLLANGVIVPSCKVGDKLYRCNQFDEIVQYTVKNINCEIITENPYNCFDISNVGKCLFLTKEEAEKALKEREGK